MRLKALLLPLTVLLWPPGRCLAAGDPVFFGGDLPSLWGFVVIAAILVLALLIHLALVVREGRIVPASLASDLDRTIGGGNYQEAWEMCRNRKGVYLAGIGAAGLEQVGNGPEAVRAARIGSGSRASRSVRIPLLALLGVAVVATAVMGATAFLAVWGGGSVVSDTREGTLRAGVLWVAVAGWFAIAVPAWIYFLGFRKMATFWFRAADERVDSILSRLPYEDLEGVQIGEYFSAGPNLSEFGDEGFRTLRVSRDLTTHCPECNAPVRAGAGACSKCGAVLNWE